MQRNMREEKRMRRSNRARIYAKRRRRKKRILSFFAHLALGAGIVFILMTYVFPSSAQAGEENTTRPGIVQALREDAEELSRAAKRKKDKDTPIVVIDAGHGGHDVGCSRTDPRTGKEIFEKDINLAVALELDRVLEKLGCQVVMTRKDDTFLDLPARTDIANTSGGIFISIHVNAMEYDDVTDGMEVYYNALSNADSEALALAVAEHASEETGAYLRKVVADSDFYVVHHADVPACLFEIGYLSADAEWEKITDSAYQKKIAKGMAAGIAAYFDFMRDKGA